MSGKRHQQWASEECVACLNGFTVGMHIAVGYLGLLVTWRRFHSHQLELKNFDIVIWVAEAPWNSHHSSLSQHFMAIFRWFWCSFICAGTTPQIHKRWGPMMPFGWARWGFCPSCVEWMNYAWRWQVLNSRANPAHPYHRFGTGNFKTLLEDTAAKGAALWKIGICRSYPGKLVKSTGLRYRKPTRNMWIIWRVDCKVSALHDAAQELISEQSFWPIISATWQWEGSNVQVPQECLRPLCGHRFFLGMW